MGVLGDSRGGVDGKILIIALLVLGLIGQTVYYRRSSPAPVAVQTAQTVDSPQTISAAPPEASTATAEAEPAPKPKPGEKPSNPDAYNENRTVSVAATAVDAENRRWMLVAFDKPVAADRVGKKLPRAIAELSPHMEGSWSFISPFMAKFQSRNPFYSGSTYRVTLKPEEIVPEGWTLAGSSTIDLTIGRFLVKSANITEDAAPEGGAKVILSGEIQFSHRVDPVKLMEKLSLTDADGTKIAVNPTTTYPSHSIQFTSAPVEKKPKARDVRLVVGKGLSSTSDFDDSTGSSAGPAGGLDNDFSTSYALVLDKALAVNSIEPKNAADETATLTIEFSAPVDPEKVKRFVKLSPDVNPVWSGKGKRVVLTGKFPAGRVVKLHIDKGLPAEDGAALEEPYEDEAVFPDLEPKAWFADKGMFLSKSGYKNLALSSVNMKKAQVALDRVYNNNIFMLLNMFYNRDLFEDQTYDTEIAHYLGDRLLTRNMTLSAPKNGLVHTPVELGKLIPAGEKGLFRVAVRKQDQEYGEAQQRWVLLTDLGLAAKMGKSGDLLVMAASFKDLTAIPGATVTVVSDQNQRIAQGTTDEAGVFTAKNLAKTVEKHRPYMITVEKDDDFSFLLFDSFKLDTAGLDVSGVEPTKSGLTAFVYGERDIWRPGETLRGMAVLRDSKLDLAPPAPLKLRVLDPQSQEIAVRVLNPDAAGAAPFSIPLSNAALTGKYAVEVAVGEEVIGRWGAQIEDFVPDRVRVEVRTPKTEAKAGEKIDYSVQSRYFFGPPAAGMAVETRVKLKPAPFSPKGFEAFNFGNPDARFEDKEIFEEKGYLGDDGEKRFSFTIPGELKPPAALEASIFTRVREKGGRGVGAEKAMLVHAYPHYPGLKRLDRSEFNRGQKVDLEYVLVAPDGKTVQNIPLKARLYYDRWQTLLKKTPDGGWKYESIKDSKLLATQEVKSAGRGTISFTPPEFGAYHVELTDPAGGASSKVEFYTGGFGYSPWALAQAARLEIKADKTDYQTGEEASFQIRAPFGGKCLVTVESDRVLDRHIVDMPSGGNTITVKFPVKADYAPNVHVQAMVFRKAGDVDPGSAARAAGATAFFVDRKSNKETVRIEAPEEVRPETKLDLVAKTKPGATLTLAAVDEGILQLVMQKTPDPFDFFYAKRALAVETFDIFSMLLPEFAPRVGKAPAGGSDLAKLGRFIRSESLKRVKPVSYWSGPLTADAEGVVRWSVDLPEFQGALRVMAVSSLHKRFGASDKLVRVKAPLTLNPSAPRFLSLKDTVEIPTTLRNDGPADAEFVLTAKVDGPAKLLEDTKTLAVKKGSEGLTSFIVRTGQTEGGAKFHFTATGAGESAKSSVELPVRSPFPPKTDVLAGPLDKAALDLPFEQAQFLPETTLRELRVAGTPLLRLNANLKMLLAYPYGCLEQTTSRAFPLLYFGDVAKIAAPELFEDANPESMVQAGIARLATMQAPGGGLAMWPGGKDAYPYGTVYAGHFLVEAKKAGFAVPKTLYDNVVKHIHGMVKAGGDLGQGDEFSLRTYALYVLARSGKIEKGDVDFLRSRAGRGFRGTGSVLLAGVLALSGDQKPLAALTPQQLLDLKNAPRQTGGLLGSGVRDLGLALSTLMDVAPNDKRIPELVQTLARMLDAKRANLFSTQETAFAFLGLGKHFRAQAAKGPLSVKILQGDKVLGEATDKKPFTAGPKNPITGNDPIKLVAAEPFTPGAAFFSLTTRGIPVEAAYKPRADGLFGSRRFLDRTGKPVDMTKLEQGDLIVMETVVGTKIGPVSNIAVQNLLPTGLEVENPRLGGAEKLPFIDKEIKKPAYQDIRDDQAIFFLDLNSGEQTHLYTLLRVVTPGEFTIPPLRIEAMYDPELQVLGEVGRAKVKAKAGH